MSDPTLTVACAQLQSTQDWRVNLERCLALVGECLDRGTDLLVFPETTASRTDDPAQRPDAQPLDGPFVAELAAATAHNDLTIIAGLLETGPGSRPFNTLVAVRGGDLIASYRKIHLYDAASVLESDTIQPGDGPVAVFDVKGFSVGMMTCYDIRFPELARVLAGQGADLIAVPTSWVQGPLKEDHWRAMCSARAIENTVYLAGASQTGGNRIGLSTVIAPSGVVTAALGTEEGLLVATVDRRRLDEARSTFPLLAQRRFTTSVVPVPYPGAVG